MTEDGKVENRFGKWTILYETDGYKRYKANKLYMCQCACGSEPRLVSRDDLLYGISKSCGCLIHEKALDLKGKTFGDLKVICPTGRRKKWGYNVEV